MKKLRIPGNVVMTSSSVRSPARLLLSLKTSAKELAVSFEELKE